MTTTTRPILVAGSWREARNPVATFTAVDPSTSAPLEDAFPVSGREDVAAAVAAAVEAARALDSLPRERIASFLEDYAARIEAHADTLTALASRETGLPVAPRLRNVELPRTTNQLRQAAEAARDRSWCRATIDTRANLRSCHRALGGPVVVFGPNNFPLAFNSAAGGDFAAAVAAGNPVIGKANPGHPGTTLRLAELAFQALNNAGLPPAAVQLIYRTPPEVGLELVSHPAVGATGFTGSKRAGLELKAAAERAGKPIYLEMSSVNPVFVLPGALEERLLALAKELFDSCTLGAGQFCTKPGITVIIGDALGEQFLAEVARLFAASTPGTLLSTDSPTAIAAGVETLVRHGARVVTGGQPLAGPRVAFANTLLRTTGEAFLANPHALQTEAFGAVNLTVVVRDADEMIAVAAAVEGNLTGSIYSHTGGKDDRLYERVEPYLRAKVGRLLNDRMPTGVTVSPAMHHGGPYPATGHPGFTSVGIPASLLRFSAVHCYDNVRQHRLPEELRDKNPTGKMWRFVDGAWSQGDVTA